MRFFVLGLTLASAAFAANTGSSQPTFYKDVVPVLQRNCQNCHRPGEAGPMSFLTYESTRPWAKAIKAAVATRKMPPWYADPHYGKFANDRTMTAADINTLVSWADSGAKPGNAGDAPAPLKFVEGWAIGKPDVVLEMPQAFNIPASGTIDYQYILVPTNFAEDRYVQMAEARPADRERVHHIIAFIMDKDNPMLKQMKPGVPFVPAEAQREAAQRAKENPPSGQAQRPQGQEHRNSDGEGMLAGGDFLVGYAPGAPPQTLKPGQAKLLKAGSAIVLQVHYTANGKPGVDKSRIGLIFASEKPTQRVLTLASANSRFEIPPGDPNYQVESTDHAPARDHAHRTAAAHAPARQGFRIPRGRIRPARRRFCFAFRNTISTGSFGTCSINRRCCRLGRKSNARRISTTRRTILQTPIRRRQVRFGEQSWDEMMIGFFDVAVDLNTDPMDILRPKKKAADD